MRFQKASTVAEKDNQYKASERRSNQQANLVEGLRWKETGTTFKINLIGAQSGQPIPACVCTAISTILLILYSHCVHLWNLSNNLADLFFACDSCCCASTFTTSTSDSPFPMHCWKIASFVGKREKAAWASSIACFWRADLRIVSRWSIQIE